MGGSTDGGKGKGKGDGQDSGQWMWVWVPAPAETHPPLQRPALSDIPEQTGQLSEALTHRLQTEALHEVVGVLLQTMCVQTISALDALETNERAILLSKARALYEVLGIFPSHLMKALPKLFGNSCAGNSNHRLPLQSGTFQSASPAAPTPVGFSEGG
jgi:hypothetical protein